MEEEEATRDARGETFDPDLIHAIFKLVWSRRAERGGGGDEVIYVEVIRCLLRRRQGEIGVPLPMQVHLFFGYLLQRLFNVLLLSLKQRALLQLNPPNLERVLPQLLLDL